MKNKMVKCKTCGAEIAKSAKKCPSCGAKNKPPFWKRLLITIGGLFALLVVFICIILSVDGEEGSSSTSSTEPKEYISATVDELYNELEANAMRAQNTYQGNYVELSGIFYTIDASGKYFSMTSYDKSLRWLNSGVTCRFTNDDQRNAIANMNTDDSVTIRGKITEVGEIMGYTLTVEEIVVE